MQQQKRIMGLDIGEKRIGVALSDPTGIIAMPLKTITYSRVEEALDDILRIIEREQIGCIVVGLPRSLNGTLGIQAAKVQEFVEKMRDSVTLPVELQDERLSTVAVEKMMRKVGTKKSKREERRDSEAAAYILQGYLDSKRPSPIQPFEQVAD